MYVKTVLKLGKAYLYACHNYIKNGIQRTKSFGKITIPESMQIQKGIIPQRLQEEFNSWYEEIRHIDFPYEHREKISPIVPKLKEYLQSLISQCLSGKIEGADGKMRDTYKVKKFAQEFLIPLLEE